MTSGTSGTSSTTGDSAAAGKDAASRVGAATGTTTLGEIIALLEERKIALDLDQDAIDWLANKGYDPAYGARPLKRVIQQRLENPLATEILAGKFNEGDAVNIDTDGRAFVFEKG